MIIISETHVTDDMVMIQIEGKLDGESVSSLRDICTDHLVKKRTVRINLAKVRGADRQGIVYLRSIQENVVLEGLNKYLELELSYTN